MVVSAMSSMLGMARSGCHDHLRAVVTVVDRVPARLVTLMAAMPVMAMVRMRRTHSLFLGTAAEDNAGQRYSGEHFGGREGRHFATGNL
jgi:hypothetical protein